MWIERKYTDKLLDAVKTKPAVLLTGVRQVGKSSLLKKRFPNADYVTLDRVALAEEAESNPEKFLSRFNQQVIIDEIQYAPSLFRELKIIIDENRDLNGKWIMTGSQQFALMHNVRESLAGRVSILTMGTLSSTELNTAKLLDNKRDMLWKGGFPEVWAENLNPAIFFEDYIQTYLERDLKDVLQVTNLRDFRRFLSLLAFRAGQLLKYSEIAKDIGVAVNTIKSWVNALEVSGIIMLLSPYYNNLGKRLIKAPKLYFCDNGLLASLLNISSLNSLENSPHLGHIWENFVFTEFIKNGFLPGKDIFFFRDQNGVEIDFICEKGGAYYLIEAKNAERVNQKKLNFNKIAPLMKGQVNNVVACGIEQSSLFAQQNFSIYNPLYNFLPGI